MPVALNHPAAVAYRGRLYVSGGYSGEHGLASAEPRAAPLQPAHAPLEAAAARAHAAGRSRGGGDRAAGCTWRAARTTPARCARSRSTTSRAGAGRAGRTSRGPRATTRRAWPRAGCFYVLAGRDAQNYTTAERYDPRAAGAGSRFPTCEPRVAASPPCGCATAASWCSAARTSSPGGATIRAGGAVRPAHTALEPAAGHAHAATRARRRGAREPRIRAGGRGGSGLLAVAYDRVPRRARPLAAVIPLKDDIPTRRTPDRHDRADRDQRDRVLPLRARAVGPRRDGERAGDRVRRDPGRDHPSRHWSA